MVPFDLAALGEQIAASVQRADADNPRQLHAQITRLTSELKAAQHATPQRTRAVSKSASKHS